MADLPTRLAFYVAEAFVLTLGCLVGLLLLRSAARRTGRSFPAVTPRKILVLGLCLLALGAATGEAIGPRAILQYYVAALTLGAGGLLWALSFAPAFRSRPPSAATDEPG